MTGFTVAYTSYFDDFNGTSHGSSCHFASSTQSSTGYISFVSNSGDTVDPGEVFMLSVQVKSFYEADGKELKLGFPSGNPGRGNNKQFSFNTTMVSADITSGDSAIFNFQVTAPVSEQLYILTADAIYRKSGSETIWASSNYAITVQSAPSDTLPPEVSILNPLNNNYGRGNIIINASVVDYGGSGIDSVWAEITNASSYNQTILMALNVDSYYDAVWDTLSAFDGFYSITVKANDSASPSNVNNTESVNVIIDNTAPSINLQSVLPDPSNGVTTISAINYSSDINNDGIRATITTPSAKKVFLDLLYQGGDEWNNTFTITEDGTYSVQINATDLAGNVNISTLTTITGDIVNPFVNITNPGNDGESIGGNVIAINGWAYGTGSNILNIFINDSRWGVAQNKPQIDPSGSTSGLFSFENNSFIPLGFYWIEINITDAAGNVNVSKRYFEVVSDDLFPPILTVSTINPNPSNGFTYITVISNEPLFGNPLLNITAPNNTVIYRTMYPTGGPRTWITNYTVLDTGIHIVKINGTDLYSNIGYTIDSFYGDIDAPDIMLDNVSPNPSNGLTVITAINRSSDINANGLWATIITPSEIQFIQLNYQGSDIWNTTFMITEDGTYSVQVNATDFAGNTNTTNLLDIAGDISAPDIILDYVSPNPSNGLTVITAINRSSDINANGLWATIITPSEIQFIQLNYQGSDIWNTTFMITEDGTYSVQVNATDFAGNTNTTNFINIIGDISAPILSVLSFPIESGANAPIFTISITEPNLDSIWYSLYNGTHWSNNITIQGLTETLQQDLWDNMPNGDILIRFYANDTLAHLGFKDATVKKIVSQPNINSNQELVSGFDLTLIISTTLAIPIISIILWMKSRTKRFIK
ncbi:MAG: Ig-like domain-containing protein [Promethearchaeota archaeon]